MQEIIANATWTMGPVEGERGVVEVFERFGLDSLKPATMLGSRSQQEPTNQDDLPQECKKGSTSL